MGLFGWMFGSAKISAAIPEGDYELGDILLNMALENVQREFGSNFVSIRRIENDSGFFQDVFTVFKGPMYTGLRDSDPVSFIQSVASTAMLAGMYAYFCAKIFQKPLYSNYPEVKRRFFEMGPIPCVMNFIRSTHNFDAEMIRISSVLDPMIDYVLRQRNLSSYCEGDKLMALAKAMYDTGITMGAYYI